MANALLISANKLRNFTDIGPNYNTTVISNAVRDAQEYILRPILGKNLYSRFITDIAADPTGSSLPTDYKTFLDEFCEPVLLWASYSELLKTIYLTPRSNGLAIRSTGAGATAADDQQYQLKQNDAKEKLDFNIRRLDEYLDWKGSLFAELSEATDVPSDDRDSNFTSTRSILRVTRTKSPLKNYDLNNR